MAVVVGISVTCDAKNFSKQITTGPMDRQIRIEKISRDQTLHLRHSVLWPDLPLSHVFLPEDDAGFHYGAFSPQRDTPIAVISLFRASIPTDKETPDPDPGLSSANSVTHYCEAVRFRQFVCEPQYQGQGYGSQLLLHALSMVQSEWGITMVWCDARTVTQEWYKRRGFEPFGPKFFKGPVEHVRMKAELKDLGLKTREEQVVTTCSVSPAFFLAASPFFLMAMGSLIVVGAIGGAPNDSTRWKELGIHADCCLCCRFKRQATSKPLSNLRMIKMNVYNSIFQPFIWVIPL